MYPKTLKSEVLSAIRLGCSPQKIAEIFNLPISVVYSISRYAQKYQRVLLVADLHCGHRVGLTPPEWNPDTIVETDGVTQHNKWVLQRRAIWDWYAKTCKLLAPIDLCVVVGDAIEGKGDKSGGTELLTTDRHEQGLMAVRALQEAHATRYHMVYGTGYHTGNSEDFESPIADHLHAKIGSHEWVEVNGCILDIKHHISTISSPMSIFTSQAREAIQNKIWADSDRQPEADILIRGHRHMYSLVECSDYSVVVLPALQGYGTKFGARICSNRVDVGVVSIDIWEDGYFRITPHLADLKCLHTSTDRFGENAVVTQTTEDTQTSGK